ncbi:histidine phosphatase family protein [Kitasatospora sp. NPDC093806]|uniref:SixA phosphatase family protein n=1 Tax=Kitasatospora sp. NPDC093806 TaxID=3155075 RepID=UPI00343C8AFA
MGAGVVRRIVVVRHAKAVAHDAVRDHGRRLAERGRRDAPAAGRWLAEQGVVPELAIVSTAARTRETWELAGAELGGAPRTVFDERVYLADVEELLAVLREVSAEVGTVVVVGHNPGVHELAETLAGEGEEDLLDRMDARGFPTSAVAVLEFDGSWRGVGPDVARLTGFRTPRG